MSDSTHTPHGRMSHKELVARLDALSKHKGLHLLSDETTAAWREACRQAAELLSVQSEKGATDPSFDKQDGTPRTDAECWLDGPLAGSGVELVSADFARQLERELAESEAERMEQARLLGMSAERELKLLSAHSATVATWHKYGAEFPTIGVAWVDWQATHIGKFGTKGARYVMELPKIASSDRTTDQR
jgi:hypothetical protein